jgi:site-specific DNA recombinase
VIGKQKLGDEVFDGEHQGIVPKALFQRVQDLLEENRSNGGGSHRNRHGALLRSILRCPACDSAMVHAPTTKDGRLYRYYRCANSMRKGVAACPTKSLPADRIEALVVDQIRRVGTSPELQQATFRKVLAEVAAKHRGLKAECKRLGKQIATAEATVAKMVHTLADATGEARSAVNAQLEKAQEHLRSLEARLAEVRAEEASLAAKDVDEASVARALEEFDAIWEVLLTPERERVLGLLIERVTYDRTTEELRIDLSPAGIATLQRELDGAAS